MKIEKHKFQMISNVNKFNFRNKENFHKHKLTTKILYELKFLYQSWA